MKANMPGRWPARRVLKDEAQDGSFSIVVPALVFGALAAFLLICWVPG